MRSGFKWNKRQNLLPNYVILSLLVGVSLIPLLIVAFNSLKGPLELGLNPLGFPRNPVWENYPNAWIQGNFSTTIKNTAILVVGTVAGVLVLGGMAAYSLAKLKLPGGDLFTLYLLISSSLPLQMFLVPLFFLWRQLDLINNLFGVIIIYIATSSPFAIFLLRSYMVQIPPDFEDAALVDGANELQVLWHVVAPLSWPCFLTAGLVVALSTWNEFLIATIFLTESKLFTVVTSYYSFSTRFGRDWGLTSASAVVMILPIIVIFLLLQRRFIEGLTQGGLKT